MKKFLLLLVLLFVSIPVFASNWCEYSKNSYIDLSSIKKVGNITYFWQKHINNGKMRDINGKKVAFAMDVTYFDMKNKKVAVKEIYFYGLDNKLIQHHSIDNMQWDFIVPDSKFDNLYNVVDNYPDGDWALILYKNKIGL